MIFVNFDQMVGSVREVAGVDLPAVPRAGDLVDLSALYEGAENHTVIRGTVSHVTWRYQSVFVTLMSRPAIRSAP